MFLRTVFAVLLSVVLPGCNLLGVRKQVVTLEKYGTVIVEASPRPTEKFPTYALAGMRAPNGKRESTELYPVGKDGLVLMSLLAGREYTLGVFTDENRNGLFDRGEPHAITRGVKPAVLSDPKTKPNVYRLQLQRTSNYSEGANVEMPEVNRKLGKSFPISLGEVVELSDARFASDAGGSGLWKPIDFLSLNRSGIYQLEPYDPSRTPVILVYGIGGSPQDWKALIDQFDRKRYQIWFYHYPSGIRLDRSAQGLARGLAILRERYRFPECHVVAHSMGGLVARRAIRNAAALGDGNFVRQFVTISTPWGGHDAAAMGVRHMKKPVPSWIDVAPESAFLQEVYANLLPEKTTHTMLYGVIPRGPVYLSGANDGVVTVKSETDERIRKSARAVEEFPYGHVEILTQPDVVRRVEAALR